MAIYLIRHGQSTINAACAAEENHEHVYHNEEFRDAPLTEIGMNQAREASQRFATSSTLEGSEMSLKLAKPDIILVSTLRRALQTATIVFDDLRDNPDTMWIASDIVREAIQDNWKEGANMRKMWHYRSSLAESRAREEFPHILFEEPHCSDADLFPELESVAQLDARCEEFLRLVRRMRKEKLSAGGRRPTIAVVAHFVFFKRLFEIYKHEGEELRIKNCQILAVSEEEFKEV